MNCSLTVKEAHCSDINNNATSCASQLFKLYLQLQYTFNFIGVESTDSLESSVDLQLVWYLECTYNCKFLLFRICRMYHSHNGKYSTLACNCRTIIKSGTAEIFIRNEM